MNHRRGLEAIGHLIRANARLTRRWWFVALVVALGAGGALTVFAWPEAHPQRLHERAQAALASKQFDRAEAELARLAQVRSPTAEDWMLRAQVALARDHADEALAALASIPDDHPLGTSARLSQAYIALYHRRARAAEAAFRRALALDPKQTKPRRELIKQFAVQGRKAELSEQYRALAALEPLSFDDVFQWCQSPSADRELAEDAVALDSYLKSDPDDRWSRLALAETSRRLGRLAEAEAILSVLPVTDVEAQIGRARLARDRGDNSAAEAFLAGLPDTVPEIARLRGELALARRDGSAAVRRFRAAQAADPDQRDTLFGLGQALRLIGKDDEAQPLLKAAWTRDALEVLLERAMTPQGRKDSRLLRELGTAYEGLNRLPEARAWYKLAIATDPLDPGAQKALFRLGESKPAR